ncbi:ABC transporter permease [Shimia sp.]|uniref:ABC transporter permease n=1 Tax=Shimia sp. TaxID=1954381 RepID=UPI003BABFB5C
MVELLKEYGPMVLSGLGLTVGLSLAAVCLAIMFGIVGAALRLSNNAVARGIGRTYTTLIRGLPDLVLMLLVFFGGQMLLNKIGSATGWWKYIEISPFMAGAITIGFIFGAYMTETFRGAFLSIPLGQIEAAKAIGMAPRTYMIRIVWPQIVPLALPSFTNNWLVLLKTTALASILGLHDIMYNAHQAGRTSQEPFLFLLMAFCIYLGLTMISDVGLRALGKRYALK